MRARRLRFDHGEALREPFHFHLVSPWAPRQLEELSSSHPIKIWINAPKRRDLHEVTLFVEPDGQTREGHEIKVNREERTIFLGLRHDLRTAEFTYRNDYRSWQLRKQKQQNDIEYELRGLCRERMDKWEGDHPMPQPPEFPVPEDAV